MSGKTLGEEFRDDLIRKAVIWGPATRGRLTTAFRRQELKRAMER
jgi:hypothetical protein